MIKHIVAMMHFHGICSATATVHSLASHSAVLQAIALCSCCSPVDVIMYVADLWVTVLDLIRDLSIIKLLYVLSCTRFCVCYHTYALVT